MDRTFLENKKIINKTGMINPHFTRKLQNGDLISNLLVQDIINATDFLSQSATLKERIFVILNRMTAAPLCSVCGVQTKLQYNQTSKSYQFTKFCSSGCHLKCRDEDKALSKRKSTNMKIFGVESPMQLDKIRTKHQNTIQNKYNGKHPKQSHISDKSMAILNDKAKLEELHITQKLPLLTIGTLLGVSDTTVGRYLHQHGINTHNYFRSIAEIEICNWLKSIGVKVTANNRTILGHNTELDIFLPEHNVAIEFNGLYWHSDIHHRIDKNTHINKFRRCLNNNITLFSIFEDEWNRKKQIVKQSILHKLNKSSQPRIYARKTKVVSLTKDEKKEFLNNNHIQGNGKGSKSYGLMYDNEIVAAITFIQMRPTEFILNRYATNSVVVGGFDKLLSHFKIQNPNWTTITTFADQRWGTGKLYELTGFTMDAVIPPDYAYVDTSNCTRIHKFNFRRKYLRSKLEHFDPTMSETENCKNNGIPRIWDCGKRRYIMNNTNPDK